MRRIAILAFLLPLAASAHDAQTQTSARLHQIACETAVDLQTTIKSAKSDERRGQVTEAHQKLWRVIEAHVFKPVPADLSREVSDLRTRHGWKFEFSPNAVVEPPKPVLSSVGRISSQGRLSADGTVEASVTRIDGQTHLVMRRASDLSVIFSRQQAPGQAPALDLYPGIRGRSSYYFFDYRIGYRDLLSIGLLDENGSCFATIENMPQFGVTSSPDGRFLAVQKLDGSGQVRIVIWNLENKTSFVLDPAEYFSIDTRIFRFSEDSRHLFANSPTGLSVFSMSERTRIAVIPDFVQSLDHIYPSPDGSYFIVQNYESLRLFNYQGRLLSRILINYPSEEQALYAALQNLSVHYSEGGNRIHLTFVDASETRTYVWRPE